MTIEQLQEHVTHNPRSPLFARLADEYLRSQRTDEALKLCLDGLQYFPDYVTAHIVVARCFAEKGDLPAALSHLEIVLRNYPENSPVAALYSDWLSQTPARARETGKPLNPSAGGETTIENAEGILDDMPIISVTLAEIYATQGAYEAAIAMYRKLQQQRPQQAMQLEEKIEELKEKIRQRTLSS